MPTELISPDEFLTRLTGCFADPSSSGTVWLTHKRYDVPGEIEVSAGEEDEFEVLIRCTHGDKAKFSSRIPAGRLPEFHAKYGSLLKGQMAPLMRKRDKKKEKAKAEAAAKKKKELYTDVNIGEQGKRGAGRRQRQRRIAAQKKKEAERERLESRTASSGATAE